MDIGKMAKLATVPTAALVAIGIVQAVIGWIPGIGEYIGCITGPIGLVITLAVLGWAGYNAVKAGKLDLIGAAGTGAIAGAASAVINGIIGIILVIVGLGGTPAAGQLAGGALAAGIGIVALIIGVILWIIIGGMMGAVLGAVGGFIAGMKK